MLGYAIYKLIVLFVGLNYYDEIIRHNTEVGLNTKDKSFFIFENLFIIFYFLIGGIGLLKMKKWALYMIGIFGMYFFIITIMDFVFTLTVSSINFKYILANITKVILGIGSVYIIKKRHLFIK